MLWPSIVSLFSSISSVLTGIHSNVCSIRLKSGARRMLIVQ